MQSDHSSNAHRTIRPRYIRKATTNFLFIVYCITYLIIECFWEIDLRTNQQIMSVVSARDIFVFLLFCCIVTAHCEVRKTGMPSRELVLQWARWPRGVNLPFAFVVIVFVFLYIVALRCLCKKPRAPLERVRDDARAQRQSRCASNLGSSHATVW